MTSPSNSSPEQSQAPVGAVLVAAGRSRRMGGTLPKIWQELMGEPVILHSLRALRACPSVGLIAVVAGPEDSGAIEALIQTHDLGPASCTPGGAQRANSVCNGLLHLQAQQETPPGLVIIHDAARPLVQPIDIETLIQRARSTGAALLASPVRDSLHREKEGMATEPVARKNLYAAETPQAMDCAQLLQLLEKAQAEGLTPTDEATLHERFLGPIALVPSTAPNPKLTWASDLPLFEAILQARASEQKQLP